VDTKTELTDPKTDLKAPAEADAEKRREELARLFERGAQGDRSVLAELREALDANTEFWDQYGDLSLQAEASLGVKLAGTNLLLGESLKRKLQALKAELGASRSPMEGLLVSRVLLSWMQANHFDALAAQALVGSQRLRELQKLQDAAHRRHLSALKTLVIVRKLLMPAPSPLDFTRLGRPDAGARGDRVGVPVRN
jgi:hypothetical protein